MVIILNLIKGRLSFVEILKYKVKNLILIFNLRYKLIHNVMIQSDPSELLYKRDMNQSQRQ